MADKYCKHNAGGGGAGTFADPYTLAELAANIAAGDTGYIVDSGTYQPGANVDFAVDGTAGNPILLECRGATDTAWTGADGEMVTIDANGGAYTMLTISGDHYRIAGVHATNTSAAGAFSGFVVTGYSTHLYRCKASVTGAYGIYMGERGDAAILCEVTDWGNNAASRGFGCMQHGTRCVLCNAHDGTGVGYYLNEAYHSMYGNTADTCTTYGLEIDGAANYDHYTIPIIEWTFYNNGSDAMYLNDVNDNQVTIVALCAFEANGGWGINAAGGLAHVSGFANAFYNNTAGDVGGNVDYWDMTGLKKVASTTTMFKDAAGADFRLNNMSGGGQRQKQITLPGGATIGYPDVGAAQAIERRVIVG